MPILKLVRHAKPAATWGEAVDPGLDDLGRAQAETAAKALQSFGPLPIYSSPLNRCRETSAPLCALWNRDAEILTPVAEIPSPPLSLNEKQKWLHAAMQGTWLDMQAGAPPGSPDFIAWRDKLIATLGHFAHDCVIFSHYIAINVAVGAAQGHDRILSFRPGHASITTLEVGKGRIAVRELGVEATDGGVLAGK